MVLEQDRSLRSMIEVENGLISREVYVNEDIFRQEQEQIFMRAWLFVGHESMVPNPGDFAASLAILSLSIDGAVALIAL